MKYVFDLPVSFGIFREMPSVFCLPVIRSVGGTLVTSGWGLDFGRCRGLGLGVHSLTPGEVSSLLSCAVINAITKSNLGEDRVYVIQLTFPTHWEVRARTWSRNWGKEVVHRLTHCLMLS